jgi:hypothetical protein
MKRWAWWVIAANGVERKAAVTGVCTLKRNKKVYMNGQQHNVGCWHLSGNHKKKEQQE